MPSPGFFFRSVRKTASACAKRPASTASDPKLEATSFVVSTAAGYLALGRQHLAGDVAAERGDIDKAIAELELGIQLQEGMLYTEPPPWYFPVRQALGAVQRCQCFVLGLRRSQVPLTQVGESAGVVPDARGVAELDVGLRHAQDLVPASKTRQRERRRRDKGLDERELLDHRARDLGGELAALDPGQRLVPVDRPAARSSDQSIGREGPLSQPENPLELPIPLAERWQGPARV